MTYGEIGWLLAGGALLITRLLKDKDKRLAAFFIVFVACLFGVYNSITRVSKQNEANRAYYDAYKRELKQNKANRGYYNAQRRNDNSPSYTYRANLPQNKSIELTFQQNKIHVSRSEGMNAQQVFLDNCKLTPEEQVIYTNNAEFQKAFTVLFTIELQNRTLRELSNKCSSVDLVETNNHNELQFDRELSKNKEIFIKHLGQSQYDCFEKHVLQDFGYKIVPAAANALYSQLHNLGAGRATACTLLADKTFQSGMYRGIAKTMNKVINNDDPLAWKAFFNINSPEQNEFDLRVPDVK